jgi:hypothetical protein
MRSEALKKKCTKMRKNVENASKKCAKNAVELALDLCVFGLPCHGGKNQHHSLDKLHGFVKITSFWVQQTFLIILSTLEAIL